MKTIQHMRRFTRLTNAFSKKVDNLRAAVALHFAHYNFVRIYSKRIPLMEVGHGYYLHEEQPSLAERPRSF